MQFTYRTGQQPLEGFTIKRGVGRGGFGEVYFALSDGGKEVALKLLQGQSDIELRGAANCLNVKHPNLVHVYDLREDFRGDKWLVMEYVVGESLAAVLNRHPNGLPVNMAKEWFGSLAKAVGYLHDRGIVHRDLKPANIFIENGTLKVGDYGLSKSIAASQRHTRTVGTVHYMAPEVSTGNYSQGVDIYASGILLYEMLSGRLPFDGESDGEILMKQMTASPDLDAVPAAFRPIIARALEKDPKYRFASLAEMAKAVDAVTDMVKSAPPTASQAPPPPIPKAILRPARTIPVAKLLEPTTRREIVSGALGAMVAAPLIAAAGLVPYAAISNTAHWHTLAAQFAVTTAAAWALLIGTGGAAYRAPDSWWRRGRLGILGLMVGFVAYWLDGGTMPRWNDGTSPAGSSMYLFGAVTMPPESFASALRFACWFGGVFALGRWWKTTAADRRERFGLFPLMAAGFWGAVLLFLWPWETASPARGFVPLILAVIAVQVASPWRPAPILVADRKLRWRHA